MPAFEANPELWSVVHIIKNIPKNLSFAEPMRYWPDLAPNIFRNDYPAFSITLRNNCNDDLNIARDEHPHLIDK